MYGFHKSTSVHVPFLSMKRSVHHTSLDRIAKHWLGYEESAEVIISIGIRAVLKVKKRTISEKLGREQVETEQVEIEVPSC